MNKIVLSSRVSLYLRAMRGAFLSLTVVACLLGWNVALAQGTSWSWGVALSGLLAAMLLHAASNVLNDYYDAQNGSDAGNHKRIYPFTGGSRLIQNGELSAEQTKVLGWSMLALATLLGSGLASFYSQKGTHFLWGLGLFGVFLAWAYSAAPLQLMSRGLGEVTLGLAWWLMVVGSDALLRGSIALSPFLVGFSFALHVVAILYLNEFPDYDADKRVGKSNLVVRLGLPRARWGLFAINTLAYGWLLFLPLWSGLPRGLWLGTLTLVLAMYASLQLKRNAAKTHKLRSAIQATITAGLLHGILLSVGMWV